MTETSSSQVALVWRSSIYELWWPELAQLVLPLLNNGQFGTSLTEGVGLLEQTVRAMSDAPSGLSSDELWTYAFGEGEGVLVRHLPAAQAAKVEKFFQGLAGTFRPTSGHKLSIDTSPVEITQALNTINFALTLARKLGYETHLAPFVSRFDNQVLLKVRHVRLKDRHIRLVSYAEGWPVVKGKVLASQCSPNGSWRRIPGAITVDEAFLDGEFLFGFRDDPEDPVIFVRFAFPSSPDGIKTKVAAFSLNDQGIVPLQVPEEVLISRGRPHEVKDLLGRGTDQLVAFDLQSDFQYKRTYAEIAQTGSLEVIKVDFS